jgi:hypothetical protein
MFAHAVSLASQYTRPIIISQRLENRAVSSGVATFVLLNKEGWALTAAHVLQDLGTAQLHKKERDDFLAAVQAINSNDKLSPGKRKHEINQLRKNWEWITNYSVWWSVDGVGFDTIHFDGPADLAVAKLNGPIDKLVVGAFPVFADPVKPLPQGSSLCRLGFPFHEVKTIFDETSQGFTIPDLPPFARFPNDGILTRNVLANNDDAKRSIHFLETSTPGLRGQSGGPIFDVKGSIWALQSRTSHFPLGFTPKAKVQGGKEVTEHQFMHVGWGTHVSHIRELLTKHNIPFASA